MKNTIIGIIVLVLILLGISAVSKKSPTTNTNVVKISGPVKVGVIMPLTGDGAAYGEPMTNVYKLAVKEINDNGGINGYPIELVIEDGKCTGEGGANAAQKLVNVDKVQVILGGFCSSESLAAVPIIEGGKVTLFSSGSSNPGLTGKSTYFARNYPGDSAQGKVLAQVAKDHGAKTIYIVVEQTDYAKGVAEATKSSFSVAGTVTVEEFPSNTTDMRQIVTKAKSANPDVFMISAQTPAVAQKILKAIKDLQWKPRILAVNDVVPGDPPTMSGFKTTLEGAYTAEVGTDPNNPVFQHALELYKTTYGGDMPFQSYGQTVWDGPFIIRDAIKAVGYDGTKIAEWLHMNVKNWPGAAGSVTIGSDGDPLVGHRAEIIKNGKAEVLK